MSAIAYAPASEKSRKRARQALDMSADEYAWDMPHNDREIRLRQLRDGSWDKHTYTISLADNGSVTCSCRDHKTRGKEIGPCKHIYRLRLDAKLLLPPITFFADVLAFVTIRDSLIHSIPFHRRPDAPGNPTS